MRWVAAASAAVLTACGFEPGAFTRLPDGGDRGGGGSDGVDADPDPDNDGVLNPDDNCPTVDNPEQRNHDADGRGDTCDLCPHLDEATDLDADGDRIGDSCDPRPALDGDSVILFEGFYDATGFAAWQTNGTWSVANGMLTQSSASDDYTSAYLPTISLARHAVTASVTLVELGNIQTNEGPTVSVVGGVVGQTQTQGYYCGVTSRATVFGFVYGFWQDTDQGIVATENGPWTGTFAVGSTYRLSGRITGAQHTCTIAQTGAPSLELSEPHGPTTGAVLLSTQRAAASYDYVFIVSVGP